jgi:MFS transporter, MHS family, alpha-ketoglutarate permease
MTSGHAPRGFSIGATNTRRRVWAIVGGSSGNLVEWYDFYVYSFTALLCVRIFSGGRSNDAASERGGHLCRRLPDAADRQLVVRPDRRYARQAHVDDGRGHPDVRWLADGGGAADLCQHRRCSAGIASDRAIGAGPLGGRRVRDKRDVQSEVALHRHRGFFASFQYVTLIGGQLLAVLVLVIMQQYLSNAELKAWGWRIPFAIGAVAAVVAFFLRRSLAETTSADVRKRALAGTIRGVFRYPRSFFTVLGFTAGGSLVFYTFTTYMQKYLVNTAGMDARTASKVMTVVLFCYMLMQPVFGALSDNIGRRTSMLCFGVFTVVATVPILSALGHVSDPYAAFGLVILALAGVSFYTSISGLVKAELFPMHVRALGVGLSYAIANAAFGGSAEYVALWFKSIGIESTFFWYVTGMCAISLIAAITMPDTRRSGHLTEDEAKLLQV